MKVAFECCSFYPEWTAKYFSTSVFSEAEFVMPGGRRRAEGTQLEETFWTNTSAEDRQKKNTHGGGINECRNGGNQLFIATITAQARVCGGGGGGGE